MESHLLAGIHTPIEEYKSMGQPVFVKREDLAYGDPYPPLAKMRGIVALMKKQKELGQNLIGIYDTRISKSGWGVAAAAQVLEMQCVVYQARGKGMPEPSQIDTARQLGAEIVFLPGGMTSLAYQRAKKDMLGRGGFMIPVGLVSTEAVCAVGEEAATIGEKFFGGSLVISVGSAITLSGVILGLPELPEIYGISCGMSPKRQMGRVAKLLNEIGCEKRWSNKVNFVESGYGYYDREDCETPFPCSPYYDKKAWKWMEDHISDLPQPILFWNIGV